MSKGPPSLRPFLRASLPCLVASHPPHSSRSALCARLASQDRGARPGPPGPGAFDRDARDRDRDRDLDRGGRDRERGDFDRDRGRNDRDRDFEYDRARGGPPPPYDDDRRRPGFDDRRGPPPPTGGPSRDGPRPGGFQRDGGRYRPPTARLDPMDPAAYSVWDMGRHFVHVSRPGAHR